MPGLAGLGTNRKRVEVVQQVDCDPLVDLSWGSRFGLRGFRLLRFGYIPGFGFGTVRGFAPDTPFDFYSNRSIIQLEYEGDAEGIY